MLRKPVKEKKQSDINDGLRIAAFFPVSCFRYSSSFVSLVFFGVVMMFYLVKLGLE